MPVITRWFVRTALVYLVAALLAGIALLLPGTPGGLQPAYFHMLMVGWVTQLIFGVVYWMFPKYSTAQPRGSDRLGWACYVLLNAGLVLRVAGEPLALGPLLAVSAVLQWLAGLAFVANTWVRVKEK